MSSDDAPRRGRGQFGLIGLVLGFLLGLVLLFVVAGNPFSSANEVTFREVVVGSVSPEEDTLCWSQDPDDRDQARTCAILALDPQSEVPAVGDFVTIGVVEIAPPGEESQRQVVYSAPSDAATTQTPSPAG